MLLRQGPQEYTPRRFARKQNETKVRQVYPDSGAGEFSMSWLPVKRTSFFLFFPLALRMPKLAIRRSRWRWYYLESVLMLNCIHLSCQDYWSPGGKKHLMSMKNTLFTRWVLESECQCSRRHLEEYNQHGVWCWWRQSWCRHVRESRFVFMLFLSLWKLVGKCTKFLCPCNILKSRLVSRLRFFLLSSLDDVTKWRQ